MAAVSERFSWDEVARQGFLASIDFFLLCQHSLNIEPFFRAMKDCIVRDKVLAECSARSSERVRRLFAQTGHALRRDLQPNFGTCSVQ
jgi:hypothetical protein